MNTRIKQYVDSLFQDAPKTRRIYELKEEIFLNINENYNNLIEMGLDEESAYNKSISNVDNIDKLIQDNYFFIKEKREYKKKSALIIAIAVAMYILCPVPLIILGTLGGDTFAILGVGILLSMIAVATGLLIYNSNTKPRYIDIDDELYEEFKEWKSEKELDRDGERSILSVVDSLTVVIYFIVSFYYGNWGVSWVIFLIGVITVVLIGLLINCTSNSKFYIFDRLSNRIDFRNYGIFKHLSQGEIKEINEYTSKIDDIKEIKFDLSIDTVIVSESNEKYVKIIEKSNYKLENDEKLKVSKNGNMIEISRNEINNRKKFNNIYRTVEIYLPKDYRNNLVLNNKLGDVYIESPFNLEKLEINQNTGDLNINSNIVCNEFISHMATGDIDIAHIYTTKYYIQTNVGDIDIKGLNGFGDIKSNIGDIECNIDEIDGDIYIESNTGDIDIFLNKDCNFNLNTKYNIGDFDTDLEFRDFKQNKKNIIAKVGDNPSNNINIKCNIGDLEINSK